MVVQIENAQNGFIIRSEGTEPVVTADFGQCINVLMQAFNIQVQQAGEEGAEEETSTEEAATEEVETEEA
tara:strand:- start:2276 stop:2485 length:210 start_codon:yes stop_codon:yes gene_type:complete